jgi:hypothetical protein
LLTPALIALMGVDYKKLLYKARKTCNKLYRHFANCKLLLSAYTGCGQSAYKQEEIRGVYKVKLVESGDGRVVALRDNQAKVKTIYSDKDSILLAEIKIKIRALDNQEVSDLMLGVYRQCVSLMFSEFVEREHNRRS